MAIARPRKYQSDAERQQAHREREKERNKTNAACAAEMKEAVRILKREGLVSLKAATELSAATQVVIFLRSLNFAELQHNAPTE